MTRKSLTALALALLLGSALTGQEAPEGSQPAAISMLGSGSGRLVSSGVEVPLPWIETASGTLVALEPVVARLGGELVPGGLGTSFELRLGESIFVLASGSGAITRGAELVMLSQPPLVYLGTLYVPIDLIDKSWGATLGVQASWQRATHSLVAERPTAREHAVDVSVVHLQKLTTLVLRFPALPQVRIERVERGFEIVAVGDRFVVPAPRRIDDPYLRVVEVRPDRIRLFLADGIDGESYRLRAPDRIVFDLFPLRTEPATPVAISSTAAAAQRPTIRTVVLDPGHGGAESGAIGPAGTMEKELTLLISRALAERLTSELGLRVALTRTEDVDLGLDERSALANQNQADLFLSIHLNSTSRGDAHGAETYFLSLQASDARAAAAAALENPSGEAPAEPGSDQFDLQLLLWDLAQSRHLAASQRLAVLIQQELNRQLELPDRGVKQAPFRVLMGAAMPAVLVELGFVSSAAEEQRLRDPAYRAELVTTLVRALSRFKAEYEAAGEAPGAAR